MVNTVQQGQSLLDIAVQHGGHADAAISIALANDISVTDDIMPGTQLIIPQIINPQMVAFFNRYKIVPATNDTAISRRKRGIGYWAIGRTFKVS